MNLVEEKLRLSEMSINEVAETLQDRGEGVQLKASEMLCQQQAEIKDLKQQVAFLEDWRDTWRPFLKAIMGKVNEE